MMLTKQSSNDEDASTLDSEVVIDYERDEHGWPITMKRNGTDTFTSIDEDGKEQTRDPETYSSHCNYTYRYDDKGRVVKGTCSDSSKGSLELTYHGNGMVETSTWTYFRQGYSSTGDMDDEKTESYTTTWQFDENGTRVERTYVEKVGSQSETRIVNEFDKDGRSIHEACTITLAGGEARSYTIEAAYTNDAQGNAIKQVSTVKGDGKAEHIQWMTGTLRYVEVFFPDGSITRSKLDYDDNFNEVLSDTETFDGPYSTTVYTYDSDGNLLRITTDYYDGSTEVIEYQLDKQGRRAKEVWTERDGTKQTTTYDTDGNVSVSDASSTSSGRRDYRNAYEWVYVKNPSDYVSISQQCSLWGWE